MSTHRRPDPSLLPIERPRCPRCQSRMALSRIEPGSGGADLRTFECPKCEHIQRVVAADPLKSDNATGSRNSELKPPQRGLHGAVMTPLCPVCKEPMKERGRAFQCEPCRQILIFFRMPDTSPYIASRAGPSEQRKSRQSASVQARAESGWKP